MISRQHYTHRRTPGPAVPDDAPVFITIRTGTACGARLVGTLVTTLGASLASVRVQLGDLITGQSMHMVPDTVVSHTAEEVEELLGCNLYPIDLSRGYCFVFGGGCRRLKKEKESSVLVRDALPILSSVGLPWWSPAWQMSPPLKVASVGTRKEKNRFAPLSLSIAPELDSPSSVDKVMGERFLMSDVPFGRLISPRHLSYLVDPWNINIKDFTGRTILQECAASGNEAAVEFLIEHHLADLQVNACDGLGNTALHLAVDGGHLDVVVLLLKLNGGRKVDATTAAGTLPCNPLQPNYAGCSPLQMALMRRHDVLVDRLVASIDCPVDVSLAKQLRGIHARAFLTHFGIEIPFSIECPVELFNEISPTPYQLAYDGNVTAMRAVLHHPLFCEDMPNRFVGHSGDTTLHVAAANGHLSMVQLVLRKQLAKIGDTDSLGRTAVHAAAKSGHTDVIEYLCTCLGDDSPLLFAPDNSGKTPLHWSIRGGHREASLILSRFARNTWDMQGMSQLTLASSRGWLDVVESLVEAGAHPDERQSVTIQWSATLPFTHSLKMRSDITSSDPVLEGLKYTSSVRFSSALWGAIRAPSEEVSEYLLARGSFGDVPPSDPTWVPDYVEVRSLLLSAMERNMVRLAHKLAVVLLKGSLTPSTDTSPPWGLKAKTDPTVVVHAIFARSEFWLRWSLDRGLGSESHAATDAVTPLRAACASGNKSIVQFLLQSVGGVSLGVQKSVSDLLALTLTRVPQPSTRMDIVQLLIRNAGLPTQSVAFPGSPRDPLVLAALLGDVSLVRLVAGHPSTSDHSVICALWWCLNVVAISAGSSRFAKRLVALVTDVPSLMPYAPLSTQTTSCMNDMGAVCTILVGKVRDLTQSPCHPAEMLHLVSTQHSLTETATALVARIAQLPRDAQQKVVDTCEEFRRSVPRASLLGRGSSAREGRCFVPPSQFSDLIQSGELIPYHRCVNRDAVSSLLKIHMSHRTPQIGECIANFRQLRIHPSPFPDITGRNACDYAFEGGYVDGIIYCLVCGVLPSKPITTCPSKAARYRSIVQDATLWMRNNSKIETSSATFVDASSTAPEPVPTPVLIKMTAFAVLVSACCSQDVTTVDALLRAFCSSWGIEYLNPADRGATSGLGAIAATHWAGHLALSALSNPNPVSIIRLIHQKYQGDLKRPMDLSWSVGDSEPCQLLANAIAAGLEDSFLHTLLLQGCPSTLPTRLTRALSKRLKLPKDAIVTPLFVACRGLRLETVRLLRAFTSVGSANGFVEYCSFKEEGVLSDALVGCLQSPVHNRHTDQIALMRFLVLEGCVPYTNPFILRTAASLEARDSTPPTLTRLLVEVYGASVVVADINLLLEADAHLTKNRDTRLRRRTNEVVQTLCDSGSSGHYEWPKPPRKSMLQIAVSNGWSDIVIFAFTSLKSSLEEAEPTSHKAEHKRLLGDVDALKAEINFKSSVPSSLVKRQFEHVVRLERTITQFHPILGEGSRWRHILGLRHPSLIDLAIHEGHPGVLGVLLCWIPMDQSRVLECLRRSVRVSVNHIRRQAVGHMVEALRQLERSKVPLEKLDISCEVMATLVRNNAVSALHHFMEVPTVSATRSLQALSLQHDDLLVFKLLTSGSVSEGSLTDNELAVACAACSVQMSRVSLAPELSRALRIFASTVLYPQLHSRQPLLDLCGALSVSAGSTPMLSPLFASKMGSWMKRLPDGIVIPLPTPLMCGVVLGCEETVAQYSAAGCTLDGSIAFRNIASLRQCCSYTKEMADPSTRLGYLRTNHAGSPCSVLTIAIALAIRDAKSMSLSLISSGLLTSSSEVLLQGLHRRVRIVSILTRGTLESVHEIAIGRLMGILCRCSCGKGSVGVRRSIASLYEELTAALRRVALLCTPPPLDLEVLGLMRGSVSSATTYVHAFLSELRSSRGSTSDASLAALGQVLKGKALSSRILSIPDRSGRLPLGYCRYFSEATSASLIRYLSSIIPLEELTTMPTHATKRGSLLSEACISGSMQVVTLLLKSLPADSTQTLGYALYCAAKSGRLEACRALVNFAMPKSDVLSSILLYTDNCGNCPLVAAAECGRDDICLYLLEAAPGSCALGGMRASRLTLLCAAAQGGAVETVRYIMGDLRESSPEGFLAATGADSSQKILPLVFTRGGGDCALLAAYNGGHISCLSVLLASARATMGTATASMRQLMVEAISILRKETDISPRTVHLLLGTTPVVVNVPNEEGIERSRLKLRQMGGFENPIETAAAARKVNRLVSRIALPVGWFRMAMQLGDTLSTGDSPTGANTVCVPHLVASLGLLSYAAHSGSAVCARICGDLGLRDVDPLDGSDECTTSLHTATRKGHVSVIQLFVRMGISSVFALDYKGRTPLDVALSGASQVICRFLLLRMIAGEGSQNLFNFVLPSGRRYVSSLLQRLAATPHAALMGLLLGKLQGSVTDTATLLTHRTSERKENNRLLDAVNACRRKEEGHTDSEDEEEEEEPEDSFSCFEVSLMHGCPAMVFAVLQALSQIDIASSFVEAHVPSMHPAVRSVLYDVLGLKAVASGCGRTKNSRLGFPEIRQLGMYALLNGSCSAHVKDVFTLKHEQAVCAYMVDDLQSKNPSLELRLESSEESEMLLRQLLPTSAMGGWLMAANIPSIHRVIVREVHDVEPLLRLETSSGITSLVMEVCVSDGCIHYGSGWAGGCPVPSHLSAQELLEAYCGGHTKILGDGVKRSIAKLSSCLTAANIHVPLSIDWSSAVRESPLGNVDVFTGRFPHDSAQRVDLINGVTEAMSVLEGLLPSLQEHLSALGTLKDVSAVTLRYFHLNTTPGDADWGPTQPPLKANSIGLVKGALIVPFTRRRVGEPALLPSVGLGSRMRPTLVDPVQTYLSPLARMIHRHSVLEQAQLLKQQCLITPLLRYPSFLSDQGKEFVSGLRFKLEVEGDNDASTEIGLKVVRSTLRAVASALAQITAPHSEDKSKLPNIQRIVAGSILSRLRSVTLVWAPSEHPCCTRESLSTVSGDLFAVSDGGRLRVILGQCGRGVSDSEVFAAMWTETVRMESDRLVGQFKGIVATFQQKLSAHFPSADLVLSNFSELVQPSSLGRCLFPEWRLHQLATYIYEESLLVLDPLTKGLSIGWDTTLGRSLRDVIRTVTIEPPMWGPTLPCTSVASVGSTSPAVLRIDGGEVRFHPQSLGLPVAPLSVRESELYIKSVSVTAREVAGQLIQKVSAVDGRIDSLVDTKRPFAPWCSLVPRTSWQVTASTVCTLVLRERNILGEELGHELMARNLRQLSEAWSSQGGSMEGVPYSTLNDRRMTMVTSMGIPGCVPKHALPTSLSLRLYRLQSNVPQLIQTIPDGAGPLKDITFSTKTKTTQQSAVFPMWPLGAPSSPLRATCTVATFRVPKQPGVYFVVPLLDNQRLDMGSVYTMKVVAPKLDN